MDQKYVIERLREVLSLGEPHVHPRTMGRVRGLLSGDVTLSPAELTESAKITGKYLEPSSVTARKLWLKKYDSKKKEDFERVCRYLLEIPKESVPEERGKIAEQFKEYPDFVPTAHQYRVMCEASKGRAMLEMLTAKPEFVPNDLVKVRMDANVYWDLFGAYTYNEVSRQTQVRAVVLRETRSEIHNFKAKGGRKYDVFVVDPHIFLVLEERQLEPIRFSARQKRIFQILEDEYERKRARE